MEWRCEQKEVPYFTGKTPRKDGSHVNNSFVLWMAVVLTKVFLTKNHTTPIFYSPLFSEKTIYSFRIKTGKWGKIPAQTKFLFT